MEQSDEITPERVCNGNSTIAFSEDSSESNPLYINEGSIDSNDINNSNNIATTSTTIAVATVPIKSSPSTSSLQSPTTNSSHSDQVDCSSRRCSKDDDDCDTPSQQQNQSEIHLLHSKQSSNEMHTNSLENHNQVINNDVDGNVNVNAVQTIEDDDDNITLNINETNENRLNGNENDVDIDGDADADADADVMAVPNTDSINEPPFSNGINNADENDNDDDDNDNDDVTEDHTTSESTSLLIFDGPAIESNAFSDQFERRKMKRKLSNAPDNSGETFHKQMKLNNQSDSLSDSQIEFSHDSTNNRIDSLTNQLNENCDHLKIFVSTYETNTNSIHSSLHANVDSLLAANTVTQQLKEQLVQVEQEQNEERRDEHEIASEEECEISEGRTEKEENSQQNNGLQNAIETITQLPNEMAISPSHMPESAQLDTGPITEEDESSHKYMNGHHHTEHTENNEFLHDMKSDPKQQRENADEIIPQHTSLDCINNFAQLKCFECNDCNFDTMTDLENHQQYCSSKSAAAAESNDITYVATEQMVEVPVLADENEMSIDEEHDQKQNKSILSLNTSSSSNTTTTTTSSSSMSDDAPHIENIVDGIVGNKLETKTHSDTIISDSPHNLHGIDGNSNKHINDTSVSNVITTTGIISSAMPPSIISSSTTTTTLVNHNIQWKQITNPITHPTPNSIPMNNVCAKNSNNSGRTKRQVYSCSACGTFHEKYNLFYHIRQVHKKFICLFCLGIFFNAERLVNHLETKHIRKPNVYEDKDDLLKSLKNQCFLMCCVCEHIFTEDDDVTEHSCENFMTPCTACGLKFVHKNNCSFLQTIKLSKKRKTPSSVQQQQQQQRNVQQISVNNMANDQSQTLLRNALMGREQQEQQRPNNFVSHSPLLPEHYNQMFDPRLNNLQRTPIIMAAPINETKSFMATSDTLIHHQHLQHPQQQQQPINNNGGYRMNNMPHPNLANGQYSMMNDGQQLYGKTAPAPKSIGKRLEHNESSSNSDDSNSDSSSDHSDAENKENNEERVVKPFRLNLNNRLTTPVSEPASKPFVIQSRPTIPNPGKNINNMLENKDSSFGDDQNESGNEDESMEIDNHTTNDFMNGGDYHPNMHISNIQMQLNDIQNQMQEIRKERGDESIEPLSTPLLVPKLKLKLSIPIQAPIESDQTSSESEDDDEDSDSEDEPAHVPIVDDVNQQMSYPQAVKTQQQQEPSFVDQIPLQSQQPSDYQYNPNGLMTNMPNYEPNGLESESSAQNTSIESDDKSISVDGDDDKPHESIPNELSTAPVFDTPINPNEPLNETQISPISTHMITNDADATTFDDEFGQHLPTKATINEILNNENVMTPPDSILDGQAIDAENENQSNATPSEDPTTMEMAHQPDQFMADVLQTSIIEPEPEIIEDIRPITEFILDQPLDKIPLKSFLRKCLEFTYPSCLYCNHARSIAVNGISLAEHMIKTHRFSATVDSITAEELLPATIEQKITGSLNELDGSYFNLDTYDYKNENPDYQFIKHFECYQCRFFSPIYKDLYLHNRKMHLRSALICLMCRSNFYSYSELVCHMCPGAQTKLIPIDLKFRCVLCNLDDIPSAFRLMVHLRKKHSACDVCLEECQDQNKLSCHVWKHKLHHLCYRCNITYRNKADITRHLFWKHGTESVSCKKCLVKKWPHVYHFCVPPVTFKCELCASTFSSALAVKVHKRLHELNSVSYECIMENCEKKFISRKLMLKHASRHYMPELPSPEFEKELLMQQKAEQMEIDGVPPQSPIGTSNRETALPNLIDQEAPIDAVISAINEHIEKQEEQEKLLKKDGDTKSGTPNEPGHKSKSRRLKKHRSDLTGILDLPTLNLSESDSDSDDGNSSVPHSSHSGENSRHSMQQGISNDDEIPMSILPPLDEDDENKAIGTETDIWENFKTYQATQLQEKSLVELVEDTKLLDEPVLLHVSQSDHDYPLMYKLIGKRLKAATNEPIVNVTPIIEEREKGEITVTFIETQPTIDQQTDIAPLAESTVTITEEGEVAKPDDAIETDADNAKPQNTSTDRKKTDSDSSSSSDSDSSCSCGSNCSCSSSSSSSGSSSSDSDSDSSNNSEKKRKKVLTKTRSTPDRRTPERKMSIGEDQKIAETKSPSQILNVQEPNADPVTESTAMAPAIKDESEIVDVGTDKPDADMVDVMTEDKRIDVDRPDLDAIIDESDLETTESETDEDFYDEHPQKLAIQMLAEKREQLLNQTCLNPVNGMPFMQSESRPATPTTLPDEVSEKEPKVRVKKRRKNHKLSRSPQKRAPQTPSRSQNPYSMHMEQPVEASIMQHQQQMELNQSMSATKQTPMGINANSYEMQPVVQLTPLHQRPSNIPSSAPPALTSTPNFPNFHSNTMHAAEHPSIAAISHQNSIRLSTSSCSDADNPLKRSKRRRIPNKFYGYTSDDDSMSAASALNPNNAFKPTPPPNLTWSKEDLPKPSKHNRSGGGLKKLIRMNKAAKIGKQHKMSMSMKTPTGKNRSALAKMKDKLKLTTTPTIPKIVIRGIPPARPLQQSFAAPDHSDVPSVPVQHISATTYSQESSSDSDSDDGMQINQEQRQTSFNKSSVSKSLQKYPEQAYPHSHPHHQQQQPFVRPEHTLLQPQRPPHQRPSPPSAISQFNHDPSAILASSQSMFNGMSLSRKQDTRNESNSNLYCYCRRPYDEMYEMIACDADDCPIEWFHFECVGIKYAPQDKWFCPQCRPRHTGQHSG